MDKLVAEAIAAERMRQKEIHNQTLSDIEKDIVVYEDDINKRTKIEKHANAIEKRIAEIEKEENKKLSKDEKEEIAMQFDMAIINEKTSSKIQTVKTEYSVITFFKITKNMDSRIKEYCYEFRKNKSEIIREALKKYLSKDNIKPMTVNTKIPYSRISYPYSTTEKKPVSVIVSLDTQTDEAIRMVSFHLKANKSDIIRTALVEYLQGPVEHAEMS